MDKRRSKIVRNRVFDCHLSPDWQQMTIENTVSSDFDPRSSIVKSFFDCRLSSVSVLCLFLALAWICLWYVIVAFPGYTRLLLD